MTKNIQRGKPKWVTGQQGSSGREFPLMPALLTLHKIITSARYQRATSIRWGVDIILEVTWSSAKTYVREDQWNAICHKCYSKVRKNPDFQKQLVKKFVQKAPEFLKFCREIYHSNLKNKTNRELWRAYEKYIRLYEDIYVWGEPFAFAARFQLADYLSDYFRMRLQKENGAEKFNEYFNILITSFQKPFITEEKEDLLKIASRVVANKIQKLLFKKDLKSIAKEITKHPSLNREIEKHTEKYRWIPYNYGAYLFTKQYFLKELKEIIVKNRVEAERKKIDRIYRNLKIRQQKIVKELKIDKYHQKLFEAMCWNGFIIDYKKKVFTRSHFYINFSLMKEIAGRLKIEQRLAHCLLELEMKKALLENKMVPKEVLEERYKRAVVFVSQGKLKLMVGKEADLFLQKQGIAEEKIEDAAEIKGQIANSGKVKGRVKIITGPKDFHKMKKGEILVAYMTTPEFVPILKRAAAIVTDEGGITCHAAIISRELGIPCIIGTKIATKVLKDGDLVEVDADKGAVKILKRQNDYER